MFTSRKIISSSFVLFFIGVSFLETTALDTLTPPKVRFECLTFKKNLKKGAVVDAASKQEILLLQSFLAVHGYLKSVPSGVFGPGTENALKAYQKASNLPVTGMLDDATKALIAQKNCGSKTPVGDSKSTTTGKISLKTTSTESDSRTSTFSWVFHGKKYEMKVPLSANLYFYYSQSPKVFTYKGTLPDNWTESYNTMFLRVRSDDYTFDSVTTALLTLARKDNFSQDDTADFILSFAQSIPYDFKKNIKKDLTQYPYETLYTNKGVCADKTFLAYELLKRAGYGVAIMQFLDKNHQAVGIRCSPQDAVFHSGYCYAETTNSLPIGMIPTSFGENGLGGSVNPDSPDDLSLLLNTDRLGKADILVRTDGKSYDGVGTLKEKLKRIGVLTKEINETRSSLASTTEDLNTRKEIVIDIKKTVDAAVASHDYPAYLETSDLYKKKFDEYQLAYTVYQETITKYNKNVKEYNSLLTLFDQTK